MLRSLALLALGGAVAVGCGEGSGSSSVTLSGKVTEYVPGSSALGQPIANVEICQFASNNCALTDDRGDYELRLLNNREVLISYVKAELGPVLVARRSGIEDLVGDVVMATDASLEDFAAEIGTAYPPAGTGFVTVTTYRGAISDGNTIAGVSYSLAGSNGRSFYVHDSGVPDTSLTETQAPGMGGFVEIAPVTVNVQLSGAVNCRSEESWLAAGTNTLRLPVRVGFSTQSRVACE